VADPALRGEHPGAGRRVVTVGRCSTPVVSVDGGSGGRIRAGSAP
jgi:hypothetical protein